VTASVIDATSFPDLAQRYQVTGVPKTIVGDETEIMGALPEADLVARVLEAGA
jgi:predicted DsbA family dithiol-disulfide isomerase